MNLLRIGAYEWIYAPQTAEYAIVDEAARLAGLGRGRKQVGFVNAVLRNLGRAIENRSIPRESADPCRCVPQSSAAGCLFRQPVLPDPTEKSAEFFSLAFSLPVWIVQEWIAEHGIEITQTICLGSNRRPGLFLQPNPLKTSPQALLDRLIQSGLDCRMTSARTNSIVFGSSRDRSSGISGGLVSCPRSGLHDAGQDPRSAARRNSPRSVRGTGRQDGPDGRANGQSRNDLRDGCRSPAACIGPRELSASWGSRSSRYAREPSELPKGIQFDAVLADVPCSNSGVMARRCEVRYRITPQAVKNIAGTQYAILEKAAARVRPGGRIVYSTCSILKEENSQQIGRFLDRHPDFSLARDLLTLPRPESTEIDESDGGFAALLIRR